MIGNQLSFGIAPDNIGLTCQRCREYSMPFVSKSRKNLLPSMRDVLQVCFWNSRLTLPSIAVFAGTDAMLFDCYQHRKMDLPQELVKPEAVRKMKKLDPPKPE